MSSLPASPWRHLTLDELSALCGEISVLTRAGVPLEMALGRRAIDLPWRLSRAADRLSRNLSAGQSLEDALRNNAQDFPPVFTAIASAGARAGRISEALQSLTATARTLADLRQSIISALIYPLTVSFVAYVMFTFLATALIPSFWLILVEFRAVPPRWMGVVIGLGKLEGIWWLAPLAVSAAVLFWWWYRSARDEILSGRGGWTLLWLPPARRMLRDARRATFCDLLALMVEYNVPLGESLRLAGDASGDQRMIGSAHALATEIEQGLVLSGTTPGLDALPPMVRMALSAQQLQSRLATNLRAAAEHYRSAVMERTYWLRTMLPGALTVAIGGTTVVLVTGMVVWPWLSIVWHTIYEAMR